MKTEREISKFNVKCEAFRNSSIVCRLCGRNIAEENAEAEKIEGKTVYSCNENIADECWETIRDRRIREEAEYNYDN